MGNKLVDTHVFRLLHRSVSVTPLLYGPDGRPLPPKYADKDSSHTIPKKRGWATRAAISIRSRIPILWRSTISRVLAVATLLSIVVFYPRVSVTPGEQIDNRDPLHFLITVSNNGQFSIYSTTLICDVDELSDLTTHSSIFRSRLHEAADFPIGTLAGGGYTTTLCGSPFGEFFPGYFSPEHKIRGHVTILIKFRPSFWPLIITRTFYLHGTTESDNRLHWIVVSK